MGRKEKKHKKDKKNKRERERSRSRDRSRSRSSSSSRSRSRSRSGSSDRERMRRRAAEYAEEKAAKKAKKEAMKLAKSFGYSNESNPFNDPNLFQPFVWKKMGSQGPAAQDGEHRVKLVKEIEKVRKRREDRERELEEMEKLREQEFRLREAAQYGDWQAKEEEFHLEQTQVRSKLRLLHQREQPIDLLAKNILLIDNATNRSDHDKDLDLSAVDIELRDPVEIFDQLSLEDLEQLRIDIDAYLQLEKKKNGEYVDFWKALEEICAFELRVARNPTKLEGVHLAVAEDVKRMFSGKTVSELHNMIRDIESRLEHMKGRRDRSSSTAAAAPAIPSGDVEYWENMLRNAKVYKAKAFVRSVHEDLLQKQLVLLEERRAQVRAEAQAQQDAQRQADFEFIGAGDGDGARVDEDNSAEALAWLRAREAENEDNREETLGRRDEVPVNRGEYSWQDKYRPRKPRYYNRVRTGYDWNKYNQTHYDHDNPPPKTVQGYKFNIFYPDLIDRTVAPTYHLEAADSPEFIILRFHAGPPYEDIAFKIINQEWELSRRRGFRCVFERGVLQLHFNFKRHRYRR